MISGKKYPNLILQEARRKEIISENNFDKKKHEHLKDLKCPKCGRGLKPLIDKSHLVGCMEYEIFICDKETYDKDGCRILIINYPHDSAEKDNKIIYF